MRNESANGRRGLDSMSEFGNGRTLSRNESMASMAGYVSYSVQPLRRSMLCR